MTARELTASHERGFCGNESVSMATVVKVEQSDWFFPVTSSKWHSFLVTYYTKRKTLINMSDAVDSIWLLTRKFNRTLLSKLTQRNAPFSTHVQQVNYKSMSLAFVRGWWDRSTLGFGGGTCFGLVRQFSCEVGKTLVVSLWSSVLHESFYLKCPVTKGVP